MQKKLTYLNILNVLSTLLWCVILNILIVFINIDWIYLLILFIGFALISNIVFYIHSYKKNKMSYWVILFYLYGLNFASLIFSILIIPKNSINPSKSKRLNEIYEPEYKITDDDFKASWEKKGKTAISENETIDLNRKIYDEYAKYVFKKTKKELTGESNTFKIIQDAEYNLIKHKFLKKFCESNEISIESLKLAKSNDLKTALKQSWKDV